MSDRKWMSSGFLQAAPVGRIDHDRGIIEGVSVCTVGEAKGHGVNLDSEFVQTVTDMGAEKRQGLKARFGHPNMCSTALGTFIGRFKNFRLDGDQCRADLFLSNEAKDTPHGNLYQYVLNMAANEPDMFGTSIVFTPGAYYRRDLDTGEKVYEAEFAQERNLSDELYVECDALHACDAVDEPAANDGLFSRFSQETIAGQITEFLDLHPQVWSAIRETPEVLEAIARYGDNVDEFINRYRAYREHQQETDMEQAEATDQAVEELEATETPESTEDVSLDADASEATEPEATDTDANAEIVDAEEPEADTESDEPETELTEDEEQHDAEGLTRDEFCAIRDEFGDGIASQIMADGGDYNDALRLYCGTLEEENETLRARVAELSADRGGGTPAPVKPAKDSTKPLIRISGRH